MFTLMQLPEHVRNQGVHLGGVEAAAELVSKGEADAKDFRWFAKYAGWAPGQLLKECKAGVWFPAAASASLVFEVRIVVLIRIIVVFQRQGWGVVPCSRSCLPFLHEVQRSAWRGWIAVCASLQCFINETRVRFPAATLTSFASNTDSLICF
jgi:hypothetical protein